MSETVEERIVRVAERFFQRSGCTRFPEARYVARRAHCRLADIEEAANEGRFCLQGYNVQNWRVGDLEVYVMDPPQPLTPLTPTR